MPRNYKKKEGVRKLLYTQENIVKACLDVEDGMSINAAAKKNNVPISTLRTRVQGLVMNPGQSGRNTALLAFEERVIANHLAILGEYGLAFSRLDLKIFIKDFLKSKDRYVKEFKENTPGDDWVYGFLQRNNNILTERKCQNINRKRANIRTEDIEKYFDRLKKSLEGVNPKYIINYDETNLVDDPGTSRLIYKKGIRRAERIMNSSKTSVSIMFAATAQGCMLPPYVVYKGDRLMDSHTEGGPINCHYNVSKSGWFDAQIFLDYLKTIIIPFCKKATHSDAKKIIIGDNLPSHISLEALEILEPHNIHMVFLPPNSTHLLQPLDVAIFHPLKVEWRKVLTQFKEGPGKCYTTLCKQFFPCLLLNLLQNMEGRWPKLSAKGFETCGIWPTNMNIVVSKLEALSPSKHFRASNVSPEFIRYLDQYKKDAHGVQPHRKRGRNLFLEPGASFSAKDQTEPTTSASNTATSSNAKNIIETNKTSVDLTINLQNYVLVNFEGDNIKPYHYVGKVIKEIEKDRYEVKFLRKTESSQKNIANLIAFKEPLEEDILEIHKEQIKKIVVPKNIKRGIFYFKDDFEGITLR